MIRVIVTLCVAEALTLVGAFAFPALLPQFQSAWRLTNTDSGWIAGVYFLGYAVAVPILSSLTDRLDARRIFIVGALICALATLGFGLFADGFWSAMMLRFLGGVGLAGVYMPGLKALVDRVNSARAISYYTASFSLGTMLSYMLTGEIGELWGWHAALYLAAGAAFVAVVLAATLAPAQPKQQAALGALLDFRPVFRNRRAMGYILGYTCHNWELFAFRAWIVGFLAFAQSHAPSVGWSPTAVATIGTGVGMAASLIGADFAIRFDRRRLCMVAMIGSGGLALVFGATSGLPYWVPALITSVYTLLIMLDSAALTTGAMLEAEPGRQGATVALHSLLGFGAAFAAPLVQGAVLDAVGGGATVLSWTLAFAAIGVVALLGPIALVWGRPRDVGV